MQQQDLFTPALEQVKAYCLKHYNDTIEDSDLNSIFKYVVPKNIFIKRSKTQHIFALMCHFRLDMEHGLAVVFTENQISEIGSEEIIL